jgi:peptidoglycan-associated lipoprotein
MKNVLIGALFAVLVAACSSTPTKDAGAPVDDKSTTAGTGGAATSGTNPSGVAGSANAAGQANPLKDPNNILSKRIVYFEYDSYTIRDQDKPIIEAHARYLVANRSARLAIQGNTDERGSREYNIALGQKRADAVKRMMVLMGVNEIQIETVSFGKEKPRNQGHDEGSWSENRRDELVYQGE